MPGKTATVVLRDLGLRIREMRLERNLTQEDMAVALGSDVRDYARIESGRRNATVRTLVKIAEELGETVQELFSAPKTRVRRPGRPRKP